MEADYNVVNVGILQCSKCRPAQLPKKANFHTYKICLISIQSVSIGAAQQSMKPALSLSIRINKERPAMPRIQETPSHQKGVVETARVQRQSFNLPTGRFCR